MSENVTTPMTVAVVGSGYMGGGIAQVLALAGNRVQIADATAQIAEDNHRRLLAETARFISDGLFPDDAMALVSTNLHAVGSVAEAVAEADFVEEAVPEKIELKQAILREISASARPDTVIASNTSTISITALAEAVSVPERFLGVHFSNPAPFIPGVEIIPHEATAERTVAVAEALVAGTGKESARVKDSVGFVLNRLQYALFHEATQIVEEGIASADDVDTIVRTTFGFRLPFFGPFAIADMAGLDVYSFCYASLQTRWPERFATPASLRSLVDAGRLGTKTGSGYLDVPADRTAELVAYRDKAYVAMKHLLDTLGPAPIHTDGN